MSDHYKQCEECRRMFTHPRLRWPSQRHQRFCSTSCSARFTTIRRPTKPDMERFEDGYMPEPNSGCWLWIRSGNEQGYGSFWLNKRGMAAHRASWILHRGPIPEGMQICHKCDVPSCVNPDHLFLGTQQDNMDDCRRKDRMQRGEERAISKLRAEDIPAIRRRIGRGDSLASIGRDYGVRFQSIQAIRDGRTWTHVR